LIKALRGKPTLNGCSKNGEDAGVAIAVAGDGLLWVAAVALVGFLLAKLLHPLLVVEELLDCVFMI
jgi:hypothetical protein